MTNQLQKDIKTMLTIYEQQPLTKQTENGAYKRLKWYINEDIQIYCKMEMKQLLKEAIQNERTELGKSVLKQILEQLQ